MKKTYENNQEAKKALAIFDAYYPSFSEEFKAELALQPTWAKILELKEEEYKLKDLSRIADKLLKVGVKLDNSGDKLLKEQDKFIEEIEVVIKQAKLLIGITEEDEMSNEEIMINAVWVANAVVDTAILLVREQGLDFVSEHFTAFNKRLNNAFELAEKLTELEVTKEKVEDIRYEYEWYKEEYEDLKEEYDNLFKECMPFKK